MPSPRRRSWKRVREVTTTVVLELCVVNGGQGLGVAVLPRPGGGSLEVRCQKRLRSGRVPEQADAIEALPRQVRVEMLKVMRVTRLEDDDLGLVGMAFRFHDQILSEHRRPGHPRGRRR